MNEGYAKFDFSVSSHSDCRFYSPKSINGNWFAAVILLLFASDAFATQQSLLARVTVYWARGGHGSDRYTRQHRCATGARLREGHCAVDPRRIPYGSRLMFPDGVLTAVDTGSAVRNRKAARKSGRNIAERNALVIDRFFETRQQALSWANSHPPFISLKVVPPNEPVRLDSPPTSVIGLNSPRIASNTIAAAPAVSGVVRNPFGRLGR